MTPSDKAIFWPLVVQAGLVGLVWLRMYQRRFAEMRRRRIDPQSLSTSGAAGEYLDDVAAADNFRNLFEVPVLFFAVCLALAVAGGVDAAQLALAWVYVALRVVHSLVHVTYNRVTHRFLAHALSTLCVLAMWVLFAVSLWDGSI